MKTQTPYFIIPAIDALPSASPEERTRLIRLIAANVGDEAALRAIIGVDPAEFNNFYPDMVPPELSTDDTISSFISRFSSETAADTPEIEEIVAAPAIDYAAMLEDEDDDEDDKAVSDTAHDQTDDVISSFLAAVPPKKPSARKKKKSEPAATPEPVVTPTPEPVVTPTPEPARKAPESPKTESVQPAPELSEALFKLMVKNKNYRKALEIITELSLNNPKKSIYFAYQMRFLKKLIKNQENSAK